MTPGILPLDSAFVLASGELKVLVLLLGNQVVYLDDLAYWREHDPLQRVVAEPRTKATFRAFDPAVAWRDSDETLERELGDAGAIADWIKGFLKAIDEELVAAHSDLSTACRIPVTIGPHGISDVSVAGQCPADIVGRALQKFKEATPPPTVPRTKTAQLLFELRLDLHPVPR